MLNNQGTFKQVQEFINAGLFRRLDLSAQLNVLVAAQVGRIEADEKLTDEEKLRMIGKLRTGVQNRVSQFAPNWAYPAEPEFVRLKDAPVR